MKLTLNFDFLSAAGVPLDADDLRLGVSLELISPPTAVAAAADSVSRGVDDPKLIELACISRHDVSVVHGLLRATDPEQAELFPPQSVRKWVYLELKAAYELRDRLNDPLGAVEQIYADFDYPEAVASFVRYMLPPVGAPVGEMALYERWARYLKGEAAELACWGRSA